jgi:hypothetical protein
MDREDLIAWPAPTMAAASFRALFAVLVDALFEADREQRHAVIDAMGGMTSGHFIVAIAQRRIKVGVQLEGDVPWLWVYYPEDGAWRAIVACTGPMVGADPVALMREQEWLLEDAIEELLGGAW